jgi:hypothetical protein
LYKRNVTCPVLRLTVHAEDAKQSILDSYPIKIYEYSGGEYETATTDDSGNVTFSATFGVYKIRLYNLEQTIVLNETYYNLINASALFTLRSNIYHANLSVKVLGYFGQPLPNLKVKLERENIVPITLNTDGNGVASFEGITGGNCLISVYVAGNTPSKVNNVYVEKSTTATFTLGKYMSVFGMIVDTSQFAVFITFVIFIAVFVCFILYRRRKQKKPPTEPSEKTS